MEFFLGMTYLRDQESSTCKTGCSFAPKPVSEYSTRTGISANNSLFTSSSRSSSRNCCVRTFCEIRGILSRSTLNRSGSLLLKSHQRITGFQRPPMSAISSSIGQRLTIRLALISLPHETRYPFGDCYPSYSTTRTVSQSHTGTEKRKMRGNESLERVRTSRRTTRTWDQCYAMERSVRIDSCAIISNRTRETELNEPKKDPLRTEHELNTRRGRPRARRRKARINAADTVLLLLDQPSRLFQVAKDLDVAQLRANTAMLAKLGSLMKLIG